MRRFPMFLLFALAFASCSSQHATPVIPDAASGLIKQSLAAGATQCVLDAASLSPVSATQYVVNGISASDAWASASSNFTPTPDQQVHLSHFNGSVWSPVPVPVLTHSWVFVRVDSIYSIATNDVWAVGEAFDHNDSTTPFVLHWNGTRWLFFRNPPSFASGHGFDFLRVAADAPNDVWIAADSADSPNLHLARWNGSSWFETTATGGNEVTGLLAISPTNVWMSVFESPTGVFHWNGTGLTSQLLPPSNGRPPENLRSLVGTGQYDLWTSGESQYIAHRSAGWSPFVVNAGTDDVHEIVAFRYGYAVAMTANTSNTGGLLVYNNVDRWRPTTSPFGKYTAWAGTSVVRGTTSFWTNLLDRTDPSEPSRVGLVVCPPNPPAPLNP